MGRSAINIAFLCLVFFAGIAPATVCCGQDLDVEYAEHMPLASESMLLDITRTGDLLVVVGERGHILRSTDGDHWTQADVVPTRSTLTTVFSLGDRLWAGGHDAVILTSGDHGKTWTRQFFDPQRQQAVMDIYFSDLQNGVAIGSYGLYLRTTDGGHSWKDFTVDAESDYHLNGLVVLDQNRWLIAGEAGYSYRSYDGGLTWEGIDLPYLGSMWGGLQTTRDCVLFFGLRGHVQQSCDFGTSWTELSTDSEASISAGADEDGFVLLAANGGTILTSDDRQDFQVHHHSSGVDFASVLALGNGKFLLVGEDGIHHYPETGEAEDKDE